MIDHTGLVVSDYARSRAFYVDALAPLGYALLAELPCWTRTATTSKPSATSPR